MRKILIVGAGQSGLHLAHGLLSHGHDVTIITGRTSTELRTGRPAVTQFTFPTVLEYERELHLDFWSALAPHMNESQVNFYPPDGPSLSLRGRNDGYVISVDRRVKMADWLEYFEDRGGKVVIHGITVSDLDFFSRMYDLIVIAVGHGELGALFDPDPERFTGARDGVVAQAHIDGVEPDPSGDGKAAWIGTSPHGGAFLAPILTAQGPAYSLFVVDRPGGTMDLWDDRPSPEEQLRRMKDVLREYLPDYYERCRNAELVDGYSTMVERFRPQVRKPVGVLPSGGLVLGIADVTVTTEPFGGQGWNNSTRCAKDYLDSILAHGDAPFQYDDLVRIFERFWEYGQHTQAWSQMISSMWDTELPPHLGEVISAARVYPEVADRWVQGWDYVPGYQEWLYDPELARKYLTEVAAAGSP